MLCCVALCCAVLRCLEMFPDLLHCCMYRLRCVVLTYAVLWHVAFVLCCCGMLGSFVFRCCMYRLRCLVLTCVASKYDVLSCAVLCYALSCPVFACIGYVVLC